MPARDARGVRCYWSSTDGERGRLTLLGDGVTVIADGVTLEQASALVAPHFVTVGAPPVTTAAPSPAAPAGRATARL
ncbi:MAG: hypothetical protein ACJ74O_15040 [Frankiaceae bacterium]